MKGAETLSKQKIASLLGPAVAAPSTHNTQPWIFRVRGRAVRFEADFSRWLKIADPEKRELFLSAGAALENFLVALEHEGVGYRLRFPGAAEGAELAATVELLAGGRKSAKLRDAALFEAIPKRMTDRKAYRPSPLAPEHLAALRGCVHEEGLRVEYRDDPRILTVVDEYMQLADAIQFADPAYREELSFWIGQGVYGTPWLMSKLGQLAVSQVHFGKLAARRNREALQGAPLFAVICAARDDRESLVKGGQALERVWLRATALGIGMQPMSQIVEVPALRAQLASLLGAQGWLPLQPFRLGYADLKGKKTPRRAASELTRFESE